MPRLTTRALLSLILTGTLAPGFAAGPIGVAVAPGTFQLDGSTVSGNATLFDGAAVETLKSSSRLQVNPGVRVDLAPASRVKVHEKYVALEKGSGELASAKGYQMEARTLRVEPRDGKAVARVGLQGGNMVLVSAVNGPVRVFNSAGLVIADVIPGTALSFMPQAGPPAGSSLVGCLTKQGNAYVLTDEASGVTVELRGEKLEENVGKKIEVTGTAFRSAEPVAGATSVIRVDDLKTRDEACSTTPAATKPEAAKAKAKTGGMSNGAKVAIVAAVGGGAIGGIVAATSKGSSSAGGGATSGPGGGVGGAGSSPGGGTGSGPGGGAGPTPVPPPSMSRP